MNEQPQQRSPARAALAVLVCAALAPVMMWGFSYLGTLPYLLGVFFFPIVGLIVGAILYRVAWPARPIPRAAVIVVLDVLVLVTWSGGHYLEFNRFLTRGAREIRDYCLPRHLGDPPAPPLEQIVPEMRRQLLATLRRSHPPGGVVGYAKWMAGEARHRFHWPAETASRPAATAAVGTAPGRYTVVVRPRQTGLRWIFRSVATLALVYAALLSQVWALTRPETPSDAAEEPIADHDPTD